jgi:hypothetical protein
MRGGGDVVRRSTIPVLPLDVFRRKLREVSITASFDVDDFTSYSQRAPGVCSTCRHPSLVHLTVCG